MITAIPLTLNLLILIGLYELSAGTAGLTRPRRRSGRNGHRRYGRTRVDEKSSSGCRLPCCYALPARVGHWLLRPRSALHVVDKPCRDARRVALRADPAEAVHAATAGGARALRRTDVGTLTVGARADLHDEGPIRSAADT